LAKVRTFETLRTQTTTPASSHLIVEHCQKGPVALLDCHRADARKDQRAQQRVAVRQKHSGLDGVILRHQPGKNAAPQLVCQTCIALAALGQTPQQSLQLAQSLHQ
jgi:hypothetical protein